MGEKAGTSGDRITGHLSGIARPRGCLRKRGKLVRHSWGPWWGVPSPDLLSRPPSGHSVAALARSCPARKGRAAAALRHRSSAADRSRTPSGAQPPQAAGRRKKSLSCARKYRERPERERQSARRYRTKGGRGEVEEEPGNARAAPRSMNVSARRSGGSRVDCRTSEAAAPSSRGAASAESVHFPGNSAAAGLSVDFAEARRLSWYQPDARPSRKTGARRDAERR